ncbi:MAG: WecB/TagA/CpsF family glycosyltransferase [Candidatus Eremiobacteraeota bacterium]|nr:WecB/TagA/CpsF family glycosyltransferase [Candidatus Eremiobacteraeota bacterium]
MEILGCRLDPVDAEQAATIIVQRAEQSNAKPLQVVTLGTEMAVYAQHDEQFRRVVNTCELSLCDTVGLLAVARSRGAALCERVTGIELIERLCSRAAKSALPIYLLGGKPGVAEKAAAALRQRYPGLAISGAANGYFDQSDSAQVCSRIRDSGAKLLLVGLGSPRQEFWLADYLEQTGCGVGIGVGGSFDVLSGLVERAPVLWRRLNLEWLYRLVREPQRWRRQLALPHFVWLIATESLRKRTA